MKRLISTILLLAAFTIVFISCKKDENDNNGNSNKDVYLLVEYSWDWGEFKLEYDDQNRITKQTRISHEEVRRIETFTYNVVGDLISIRVENPKNPERDYTRTIVKNGNVINFGFDGFEYWTMELNADGLPVKWIRENENSSFIQTFDWQDGNVIHYVENDYPMYLKYDNKKNPMLYCKTPKWYLLLLSEDLTFQFGCKNNITNFGEDYGNIQYTYNEAGFPLSTEGGGMSSMTYKYEKK